MKQIALTLTDVDIENIVQALKAFVENPNATWSDKNILMAIGNRLIYQANNQGEQTDEPVAPSPDSSDAVPDTINRNKPGDSRSRRQANRV